MSMEADIVHLTSGLCRCDEASWRDFHARYYDFLLNRVRSRGVGESDAPEVVQRIYLRVLKNAKTFAEAAGFEAWLSCLARSEAIDTSRGAVRRSWLREKFQSWATVRQETAPAPAGSDRLHEALTALDGSDRRLVTRHYLGGWSQEELAKEHGVTVKAIESRLARLRLRLRSTLENPETC